MEDTANLIRNRLRGLGERGVLRSFAELPEKSGKLAFRFRWLHGAEFTLEAVPDKKSLVMAAVLPSVQNRSFMDTDLRKFIKNCSSDALLDHRRVDAEKATLSYKNQRGNVSLNMRVLDDDFAYAVTKILNVTNELFKYIQLYHIEYLYQYFGLPEE